MNCNECGKESMWLESVGRNLICHKCLSKNKLIGQLVRTHIDSFHHLVKKSKITSYDKLMKLDKSDILKHVKLGRVLNT
ncbi:hypothetical protein K9M79_02285 [Candidatus Woesearchaeota archaeon]|nr:hypothetical protein [Candidatus Woesearchaeota archaeon]